MPGDRTQPRPPDAPQIAPGTLVAEKYVVEELLGTGAMGFVMSATHKLIGQRVAIKFIKAAYIDSEDARIRFTREARALVAVQSENVVRVFDYGMLQDESPYLVMEYLVGRDLQKELRARGRLPVAEAAEIVLQACEGLAAAHARGIIHRDIKPANLFLTKRANGKLLVKIVDFGISKSPKTIDDDLSMTRGSIGSPHYMSPEQLRNAKMVDARSDVWSLGVTLHRALTGELPFSGESVGTLLAAVLSNPPRTIREECPELPREIEAVVSKCLRKNAVDRYANVQELADALAPFAMPSDRAKTSGSLRADPSPTPPGAAALHESTAQPHVSQVPAPAVHDSPEWKPRAALAAAIGVPLIAVFIALKLAPSPTPQAAFAPDAALPPAMAITDLPIPRTSSPAAAAAYESALQAVRDASFVHATNGFDRAASLDPTMAAAQLRSAMYGDWLIGADTRRHARDALALRASLTEEDRALLGAVEPLYLPPHPDMDEAQRRVNALVTARPRDTEVLFLSALLFFHRMPRAEIERIAGKLSELDPKFAGAWWLRALSAELAWDEPAAAHAVETCLAISPTAASCLRVRATIEDARGECIALEADAQRMVAMEDDSYRAHDFMARALYARHRPIDAVRESLGRKWSAIPEHARPSVQLEDDAALAIAGGDFATALKDAHALEKRAETGGTERDRAAAATLLIDLHTELGEAPLAARVADAYLRRVGAWPASDSIDEDPRPLLYAVAAREGLRKPEERDAALADWLTLWKPLMPPVDRARVWVQGYAVPAQTREEAQAALAALPEYGPPPTLLIGEWTAPPVAKVYALAGRSSEALPHLRLVASSCHVLAEPMDFVRSQLLLGEALEAAGDPAGACAAYAAVIDRWGAARRSVTASAAAARAKVLACSR